MLSDRLKKKVKQACCKNILPLVIIDWLLNGSVKDREDVYSILSSLQHTTEILNGIYGQIHNKIDSNQVKEDLYKDLKKVLLDTKMAKLTHYSRGNPPVVFYDLMRVRKQLKE